ncbi:hypothetical protein LXA25_18600, partial [Erwinia amylovora]|uniref:hypothetical protein n=1 Tax=Erwinia amylovora TaxID=552 RepID=UPI0020BEFF8B
ALSFIYRVIGPLISIVESPPLAPEDNRQNRNGLLYLVLALGNLVPRLYNSWLFRKLMGIFLSTPVEVAEGDIPRLTSEVRVMAERFYEA